MAVTAAPRIFVSYARSDGKKFAGELRRRLQDEHGFPLWHDLADMEGGKDWWQQITEAIDHIEFLVLVMTPAALASPIVRKEWRYARQQGRSVIPVIGAKGIDFDSLPGWMRRAHFVDPEEPDQWRRFVRTLEAPCRATRAPFMVEDLPQVFVRRPRELDQLVASLLDQSGEEPVAITAELKGAGGYGKTTLARAICHDERVQNAFDDGILWVTLGEQPGDVQSRVVDLIEVLTSERPGFQTTEAAVTRLGEVIGERRILIVIDDVWQAAHARPFLQVGRHCARLITTRNRDALPPNAKPLDVDAMTAAEAIRLLRFGLPDGEDAAFARLAHRLGEWPLLLKLVNGALHKRVAAAQPLAAALAWVTAGLDRRGLTIFDARNPVERGDAVAKTLGVSLELFTDDERARLSELAIFPEDVDVPVAAVETLWSRTAALDEFETEDLCTRLYDQSLLLSLDLATRHIRLHDVIRGYLQAGQKDRLPTLHAEMVEAYRARCADGWHSGPNDGYFFQGLPRHLREAGQADELLGLLFDYRWLRAKSEAVSLAGVIQDFEQLGTDEQAQKMAAALRLSAHVLESDPRQLAGQLLGRLAGDDGALIRDLLANARERADRPALLPMRSSLTPPGTGLIRILVGHSSAVRAVAALAERGQALSAGADGTVRLWDLASGQELQHLAGHTGGVNSVAPLPERGQALSAGSDGTVRLWDLTSGQERHRFAGHRGVVWAIAVLPERGHALSAGRTVRLWDLDSGREVQRFAGHGGRVLGVAVLPERAEVLSAGDDGTVRLWDITSGKELQCFVGHNGVVRAVAALPERGQALSAGDDGTVRLWDLNSGQEMQRFEGHRGGVRGVVALPERGQVLSAGADHTVRVWDLNSGQEVQRFVGHSDWVRAAAVLPDRSQVLSAGDDGTVRLWDLASGTAVRRGAGHRGGIWVVAVLPERGQALSAGDDGTVRLWDLASGTEVQRLAGHSGRVWAVAALPERGQALSAGDDGTMRLWDLASGTELERFERHRGGVKVVAVLPERGQVLSAGEDGTVRLWEFVILRTFRGDIEKRWWEMRRLEGHGGGVWAVAALPERNQALSAGEDGTVRLWDLASGTEMQRFEGHRGGVRTVAALPEHGQALSAGDDGTVRLWDLRFRWAVRRLVGHSGGVWALAVMPERGQALSAGDDGTVRLWDLASGTEVQRLVGHSGGVWAVAALPERGQALSAGDDGVVRLWNFESGTQLAVFTAEAQFSRCAVTPDGRLVVAGDRSGQIHMLEILL